MTYGELVAEFDDLPELGPVWSAHPLCDRFGELDVEDAAFNRPFRTAIVVNRDDRLPGPGFFKMYVTYRNPKARCRSDADRIAVHLRELGEVARHYGHV